MLEQRSVGLCLSLCLSIPPDGSSPNVVFASPKYPPPINKYIVIHSGWYYLSSYWEGPLRNEFWYSARVMSVVLVLSISSMRASMSSSVMYRPYRSITSLRLMTPIRVQRTANWPNTRVCKIRIWNDSTGPPSLPPWP